MRIRVDERKKVVNKGFKGKQTVRMEPNGTAGKPNETGVVLLFRYSVSDGEDEF